jgi:Zn-dependent peptidase ImmA (M78 family)
VSKLGDVRYLVRQRMPAVARAMGLDFKREPTVARRTRAEIRDYAIRKLNEEYPPAEVAGYESALRLFGLIPDTLDLRSALMRVLGEQIAGYYDPDSSTLYVASDVADSFALRTTISHELAHALQHQYLNLDSLITQKRQQDRAAAAKALLEGQATLAQTLVMMPEQQTSLERLPSFVETWSALDQQQSQMKEFQNAPLWLRESLVFPYLAGADFVVWYRRRHGDEQPFGAALPVSTEQILHPDRYDTGDVPTGLALTAPTGAVVRYEDGLGEFEIRVLFKLLLPDNSGLRAAALAAGWDGDRYQVLTTARDGEDALVWYSVWDDAAAADRFARSLERVWPNRRQDARTPRRQEIARVTIDGVPGVRLVDAPVRWPGWTNLPVARVLRQ